MRSSAGLIFCRINDAGLHSCPGLTHPKYGTNWGICALQMTYKERIRGVPYQLAITVRWDHGIAIASYGLVDVLAKHFAFRCWGALLRTIGKGLELFYSIQRHKKWSMMDSKDDS